MHQSEITEICLYHVFYTLAILWNYSLSEIVDFFAIHK